MESNADNIAAEIRELKSLIHRVAESEGQPPKRLLTVDEACAYLSIGKTFGYTKLQFHVRTIRHGKKILFPREELDALIERGKRTGELFS